MSINVLLQHTRSSLQEKINSIGNSKNNRLIIIYCSLWINIVNHFFFIVIRSISWIPIIVSIPSIFATGPTPIHMEIQITCSCFTISCLFITISYPSMPFLYEHHHKKQFFSLKPPRITGFSQFN